MTGKALIARFDQQPELEWVVSAFYDAEFLERFRSLFLSMAAISLFVISVVVMKIPARDISSWLVLGALSLVALFSLLAWKTHKKVRLITDGATAHCSKIYEGLGYETAGQLLHDASNYKTLYAYGQMAMERLDAERREKRVQKAMKTVQAHA